MAANQKVERLSDSLTNQLTMRGLTVAKTYLTAGTAGTGMGAYSNDVVLTVTGSTSLSPTGVSAVTMATKACVVIKPTSSLYGQAGANQLLETDGLGLIQRVYNPLVCQVLLNGDTATNGAAGTAAYISSRGYENLIVAEVMKLGVNTEIWEVLKLTTGAFGPTNSTTWTDAASGTNLALACSIVQDAFYPYAGQ